MISNSLTGLSQAIGLAPDERALVQDLVDERYRHEAMNATRWEYYRDKNPLKNLGLAVPADFLDTINTSVGWCAKSVDMLAARSRFDGFTAMDDDVAERLRRISASNSLDVIYSQAAPMVLTHGCGFWTVSRGDEGIGEQRVIINFHDAISSSAKYDYRTKSVKAGMVVEDYRPIKGSLGNVEPCLVVVHTPTHVITIKRGDGDRWFATHQEHGMGRPMMEAMGYRPMYGRFGKSRVSRAMMGITDEMQREIVRTAVHSECFSAPQKYMLGADDDSDMFDMEKFTLAYNSFMVVGTNENGDAPTVGQFAQASMEPHLSAMRNLASRAAADSSLPVSCFGIIQDNPSSAEALRASMEDLIVEVEAFNRTSGAALRNIALMALAIDGNTELAKLTQEELDISVHWADPANPSEAAKADAILKQTQAIPGLGDTDVALERLGYSSDERRRIKADIRAASMTNAVNAMFAQPTEG